MYSRLFLLLLLLLALATTFAKADLAEEQAEADEEPIDEAELARQFEQFKMQQEMFGGSGGNGRRFAREIPPVQEDVPHVQCQACEELVREVNKRVSERRAKFPKTKLTEMQILEMLTGEEDGSICDPVLGTGQWLSEYDIVQDNERLKMVHQEGKIGHCEEECKTMAAACQNVLDAQDSEMAELAYLNKLTPARVCHEQLAPLSGRCGDDSLVAVRKDREDYEFRAKSEIDIALAEASKDLRYQQKMNPDMFREDL